MLRTDIYCIDTSFLAKIEKPFITNLSTDQLENKSIVVSRQDCLLSQALRLVSTYDAIDIDRQTRLYLDLAKETQNYKQNFLPHEKEDINIFNFGCPMIDPMYDLTTAQKGLNKVVLKHILRKAIRKPDFLIYLDLEYETIKKRKNKFPQRYKVEVDMRGKGIFTKQARLPELLDKLKEMYDVDYAIIKVEEKSPNQISKEIIQVTKDFYERRVIKEENSDILQSLPEDIQG